MSPHEPGALVVHIPLEEQPLRVAARPDVYFVTPHYEGYGCVLLRLERVDEDELAGAIEDAWEYAGTEAASLSSGGCRAAVVRVPVAGQGGAARDAEAAVGGEDVVGPVVAAALELREPARARLGRRGTARP